jgi:uncharacterized membrane protein
MSQFPPEVPPPLYVPPPSTAAPKDITDLPWSAPWQWLACGLRDLKAHPGIGLFYGGAFWGMALVLGAVFRAMPEYTMTITSGCLLLGPFLALGLYDVSRRRELGLTATLLASATCWRPHVRSMGMLVLVLIVLELLWGRASLVVIAVFFNTGMPSSVGVVQAVFNAENWEFLMIYLLVGGVFAMLVFSISVVSIPMILHRDTDAITAAITSLEVFFSNTGVMLVWGALIASLVGLSLMMPWAIGLVVLAPLLGHASWHAYRNCVHWLPMAELAAN